MGFHFINGICKTNNGKSGYNRILVKKRNKNTVENVLIAVRGMSMISNSVPSPFNLLATIPSIMVMPPSKTFLSGNALVNQKTKPMQQPNKTGSASIITCIKF